MGLKLDYLLDEANNPIGAKSNQGGIETRNWLFNQHKVRWQNRTKVGLKRLSVPATVGVYTRQNRTKVGLKPRFLGPAPRPTPRQNRTKVGLKRNEVEHARWSFVGAKSNQGGIETGQH